MPRTVPARSAPQACQEPAAWSASATPATMGMDAASDSARVKDRFTRLAHTLESDVIPRLVKAHRPGHAPPPAVDERRVREFVEQLIHHSEARIAVTIEQMRADGVSVETLYLDFLAPAARLLGRMWEDDLCDFSTVTLSLGRLQRLLRELSGAFGTEVGHPPNGRRVVFMQPNDEQHSFGLSMVAEFFRRDGWDVVGGIAGAVPDPASKVRHEWFDVAAISVGSELQLPWLRQCVAALREASCNRALSVLVGGPLFRLHPDWVGLVGADATADDAKLAPQVAERMLSRSAGQRR